MIDLIFRIWMMGLLTLITLIVLALVYNIVQDMKR